MIYDPTLKKISHLPMPKCGVYLKLSWAIYKCEEKYDPGKV